jgi:tRNA (adenine22-N1)-methyltransferase
MRAAKNALREWRSHHHFFDRHPDSTLTLMLDEYLEHKVTQRIVRLGSYVVEGRPTFDLCCDHGLIGLWAWSRHPLPELHFVDRAPGVVAKLESALGKRLDLERFFFHAIDAAELKLPSEPCNVIVAGVGYRAMVRIIEAIYPIKHPHRLIISVHAEEESVEPTLKKIGWRLHEISSVEERGRIRSISAWDG